MRGRLLHSDPAQYQTNKNAARKKIPKWNRTLYHHVKKSIINQSIRLRTNGDIIGTVVGFFFLQYAHNMLGRLVCCV